MGYALFAQRKLILTGRLNGLQLQLMQRDDEQFSLAEDQAGLKQQLGALSAAQAGELAVLYKDLSEADSGARDSINARIAEMQNRHKQQQEEINRQTYELSIKENILEMEKKHLETRITKIEKELEAVEQAEGKAIDRGTPKFSGIG